eukprot:6211282-Pleurochrysis_carterae.AAC.1
MVQSYASLGRSWILQRSAASASSCCASLRAAIRSAPLRTGVLRSTANALALALCSAPAWSKLYSSRDVCVLHVGLGAVPRLRQLGVREGMVKEDLGNLVLESLGQAPRTGGLDVVDKD